MVLGRLVAVTAGFFAGVATLASIAASTVIPVLWILRRLGGLPLVLLQAVASCSALAAIAVGLFVFGAAVTQQQAALMTTADYLYECAAFRFGVYPAGTLAGTIVVSPYETLAPRYNDWVLYVREGASEFMDDLWYLACAHRGLDKVCVAYEETGASRTCVRYENVTDARHACRKYSFAALFVDPVTKAYTLGPISGVLSSLGRLFSWMLSPFERITSWQSLFSGGLKIDIFDWSVTVPLLWLGDIFNYGERVYKCWWALGFETTSALAALQPLSSDCVFCSYYDDTSSLKHCAFMDEITIPSLGASIELRSPGVCESWPAAYALSPFDYTAAPLLCRWPERHLAQCAAITFGSPIEALLLSVNAVAGGTQPDVVAHLQGVLDGMACMASTWRIIPWLFISLIETAVDVAAGKPPCIPMPVLPALENLFLSVFSDFASCFISTVEALFAGIVDDFLMFVLEFLAPVIHEILGAAIAAKECASRCHISKCFDNFGKDQAETSRSVCNYAPTDDECGAATLEQRWLYIEDSPERDGSQNYRVMGDASEPFDEIVADCVALGPGVCETHRLFNTTLRICERDAAGFPKAWNSTGVTRTGDKYWVPSAADPLGTSYNYTVPWNVTVDAAARTEAWATPKPQGIFGGRYVFTFSTPPEGDCNFALGGATYADTCPEKTANAYVMIQYDVFDGFCEFVDTSPVPWFLPSDGTFKCVAMYADCLCSEFPERYRGPDDPSAVGYSTRNVLLIATACQGSFAGALFEQANGGAEPRVDGLSAVTPADQLTILAWFFDSLVCPAEGIKDCLEMTFNGDCTRYRGNWHDRDPSILDYLMPGRRAEESFAPDASSVATGSRDLFSIYASFCDIISAARDGGTLSVPLPTWEFSPADGSCPSCRWASRNVLADGEYPAWASPIDDHFECRTQTGSATEFEYAEVIERMYSGRGRLVECGEQDVSRARLTFNFVDGVSPDAPCTYMHGTPANPESMVLNVPRTALCERHEFAMSLFEMYVWPRYACDNLRGENISLQDIRLFLNAPSGGPITFADDALPGGPPSGYHLHLARFYGASHTEYKTSYAQGVLWDTTLVDQTSMRLYTAMLRTYMIAIWSQCGPFELEHEPKMPPTLFPIGKTYASRFDDRQAFKTFTQSVGTQTSSVEVRVDPVCPIVFAVPDYTSMEGYFWENGNNVPDDDPDVNTTYPLQSLSFGSQMKSDGPVVLAADGYAGASTGNLEENENVYLGRGVVHCNGVETVEELTPGSDFLPQFQGRLPIVKSCSNPWGRLKLPLQTSFIHWKQAADGSAIPSARPKFNYDMFCAGKTTAQCAEDLRAAYNHAKGFHSSAQSTLVGLADTFPGHALYRVGNYLYSLEGDPRMESYADSLLAWGSTSSAIWHEHGAQIRKRSRCAAGTRMVEVGVYSVGTLECPGPFDATSETRHFPDFGGVNFTLPSPPACVRDATVKSSCILASSGACFTEHVCAGTPVIVCESSNSYPCSYGGCTTWCEAPCTVDQLSTYANSVTAVVSTAYASEARRVAYRSPASAMCQLVQQGGLAFAENLEDLHCRLTDQMFDYSAEKLLGISGHKYASLPAAYQAAFEAHKALAKLPPVPDSGPYQPLSEPNPLWRCSYLHREQTTSSSTSTTYDWLDEAVCAGQCVSQYAVFALWAGPLTRIIEVIDAGFSVIGCLTGYNPISTNDEYWKKQAACTYEMGDAIKGLKDYSFTSYFHNHGVDVVKYMDDIGDAFEGLGEALVGAFVMRGGQCGVLAWISCTFKCMLFELNACRAENSPNFNPLTIFRKRGDTGGVEWWSEAGYTTPPPQLSAGTSPEEIFSTTAAYLSGAWENGTLPAAANATAFNETFAVYRAAASLYWAYILTRQLGVSPRATTCGAFLVRNPVFFTAELSTSDQMTHQLCMRALSMGMALVNTTASRDANYTINDFLGINFPAAMGTHILSNVSVSDVARAVERNVTMNNSTFRATLREAIAQRINATAAGNGGGGGIPTVPSGTERELATWIVDWLYNYLAFTNTTMPDWFYEDGERNATGANETSGKRRSAEAEILPSASQVISAGTSAVRRLLARSTVWNATVELYSGYVANLEELKARRREKEIENAKSVAISVKRVGSGGGDGDTFADEVDFEIKTRRLVAEYFSKVSYAREKASGGGDDGSGSKHRRGDLSTRAVQRFLAAAAEAHNPNWPALARRREELLDGAKALPEATSRAIRSVELVASLAWDRYDLSRDPSVQGAHLMAQVARGKIPPSQLARWNAGEVGYTLERGIIPRQEYDYHQKGYLPPHRRGILGGVTGSWSRPSRRDYMLFMAWQDCDALNDTSLTQCAPAAAWLIANSAIRDAVRSVVRKSESAVAGSVNVTLASMDSLYQTASGGDAKPFTTLAHIIYERFLSPDAISSAVTWASRMAFRAVHCRAPHAIESREVTSRLLGELQPQTLSPSAKAAHNPDDPLTWYYAWNPFCLPLLFEGAFDGWAHPTFPNAMVPSQLPWPSTLVKKDCANAPFNGDRLLFGRRQDACSLHYRWPEDNETAQHYFMGGAAKFTEPPPTATLKACEAPRHTTIDSPGFMAQNPGICGDCMHAWLSEKLVRPFFFPPSPASASAAGYDTKRQVWGVDANVTLNGTSPSGATHVNVTFRTSYVNGPYLLRNTTSEAFLLWWLDCTRAACIARPDILRCDDRWRYGTSSPKSKHFCGFSSANATFLRTSANVTAPPDSVAFSFEPEENCERPLCILDSEGSPALLSALETAAQETVLCDVCKREYLTCRDVGYGEAADALGYVAAVAPLLVRWVVSGSVHAVDAGPWLSLAASTLSMFLPISALTSHIGYGVLWFMVFFFETGTGTGNISAAGIVIVLYAVASVLAFGPIRPIAINTATTGFAAVCAAALLVQRLAPDVVLYALDEATRGAPLVNLVRDATSGSGLGWIPGAPGRFFLHVHDRMLQWRAVEEWDDLPEHAHFCFFVESVPLAFLVAAVAIAPALAVWFYALEQDIVSAIISYAGAARDTSTLALAGASAAAATSGTPAAASAVFTSAQEAAAAGAVNVVSVRNVLAQAKKPKRK